MSLPRRPWTIQRVKALNDRAVQMSVRAMTKKGKWHRLRKRADRLAKRYADLACQTMNLDPHAPASLKVTGRGDRKPRKC